MRTSSWTRYQRAKFLENLRHHRPGECTNPLDQPSTPVETLDLIREHNTSHWKSGRDRDLERIPFDPARDRTHQREANLAIVCYGREHNGGSAPCLFVAGLRGKGDPPNVSSIGGC